MRHDARQEDDREDDLLAAVDRLLDQPELTTAAVGEAVGVGLVERPPDVHPYYRLFDATAPAGAAAGGRITVSYREPVDGHTGPRIVTLELGEPATLTIDDLMQHYGTAAIGQIMPDAGAHGLVTYTFETGRIHLSATRSGAAPTVRSVTLTSPST